jgi:hypothetical protein
MVTRLEADGFCVVKSEILCRMGSNCGEVRFFLSPLQEKRGDTHREICELESNKTADEQTTICSHHQTRANHAVPTGGQMTMSVHASLGSL